MDQAKRIRVITGESGASGGTVLYWMQAAVRTRYNHALEYAIHLANHRGAPLTVFFVLTPDYPGATERHYRFLLEGLRDAAENLSARGIPFTLCEGNPGEVAAARARGASTIVTELGYTRPQRRWREVLVEKAPCPVVLVDTNAVVPVEVTSPKEEYSAATIRPKIHRLWEAFLKPVEPVPYHAAGPVTEPPRWPGPPGPAAAPGSFHGGENRAGELLGEFLSLRLREYGELRNAPDRDWTSRMSPYLHFGNISPVEIALRAMEYRDRLLSEASESEGNQSDGTLPGSVDTLLEELIVRRELAINFTWYNECYDSYRSLPNWAITTLEEHSGDERPAIYTARQLEAGETGDPFWNACQHQMVESGMMHGYMRMYWGKKILEWTQNPRDAYELALELNDRYELDGRDPNGYAGVAWCFGKHDRPWVERPVFGKVRYMNDRGLKRKFKGIDRYVTRWGG
ncbi:MAG: deoxyribodipyrimidine photolyase [Spirochaetaceae bacterium]|nr:MAG: deoxyribodipyrimidine photolyase [Spirochaetaceae bacterium]